MNVILLLLILVLFFGAFPIYPYSATWGPYPASGLGIVVLVLVILFFMGRL
jgi:hypothetical protein